MDSASEPLNRARRVWLSLGALVISALLLYFGTGLTPIAALTWVAPIPVLLVAPRISGWAAFGVAFAAYGLATSNSWGFYLHSHDTPLWPVGALICVCFTATFAASVALFRALAVRRRAMLAAFAGAALWTSVLYIASVASPMGIAYTLAATQAGIPVLVQSAAVAGMWALEFLVLFVPCAIAALAAPQVNRAARWRTASAAVAVLAVVLIAGAVRLGTAPEPERTTRVALLSNDHSGWGTDIATSAGEKLMRSYIDKIDSLPDNVDTVVLPEGEFKTVKSTHKKLVEPLTSIASKRHLTIVVGDAYVVGDGRIKYNYARVITAKGEVASYLKHHDSVSPHGHKLVYRPGTDQRVGLEICLDVNLMDTNVAYARAGTRVLLIPAADEGVNGRMHSRTALFRGVENGMAIAWSDRTGQLMVADGYGRILAEKPSPSDPGDVTSVVAKLPYGPGETLYTRIGDVFAWCCVALTLAGIALAFTGRRAA